MDEREELLDRVDAAARAAGRIDELADARRSAQAWVVRALSFRSYDPTWFGLNWGRSLGRADDRANLLAAVVDAATAAVVADLAPDDAAALAEPFEIAASMAGTAPSSNPRIGSAPRRGLFAGAGLVSWLIGLGPALLALAVFLVSGRRRRAPLDRE